MINSTDRDQILRWIDSRDGVALAGVSSSLAAAFLSDLLESVQKEYPLLDEDWLTTQVRQLRLAGHGALDLVALAWLETAPSSARLDIVSVVLQSLWLQGQEGRAIDPTFVDRLMAARRNLTLGPESDASSLFALVVSLDAPLPNDTHDRVLDVLAEASARSHENPAVKTVLSRVLDKAGRRV